MKIKDIHVAIAAALLCVALALTACGQSAESGVINETETEINAEASSEAVPETEEEAEAETVEASLTQADAESTDDADISAEADTTEAASADTELAAAKTDSEYTYADVSATMYATDTVNIRTSPTTDGDISGTLPYGTSVTVTARCNETGWYRIDYNDDAESYVSDKYLSDTQPDTTTAASSDTGTSDTDTVTQSLASAESDKDAQARAVAQQIADSITGGTDLEKVRKAAQIVALYCANATYTSSDSDYKTAYGVFCKGVYTCAGSTRALGLVLECMGYSWEHVNANQYSHQWCKVTMDGQIGWADGMGGIADYGECPFAYGGSYTDSNGVTYAVQ